jgi:hypothetical protein
LLIDLGARLDMKYDPLGNPAIRFLVEMWNMGIHTADGEDRTALYFAANQGNIFSVD